MLKRKRLIRRALILWLLSLMVVSPALAHSGSLDSNGGHWDHSTGTYHYHSGEHTEGSSGSSSGYSYSTGSYYATTGSVNLREGPSTDYRIITTLNPGVRVKYISSTQGWYRVNYNGQIGYVSGNYLEPTSAPVSYNKSVVSKSAAKAATPKPTAKPASGSSKSASGKKELLPMTIGNIIFIFCAGLGVGLIILAVYASKVSDREIEMSKTADRREADALTRGKLFMQDEINKRREQQSQLLETHQIVKALKSVSLPDVSKGVVFASSDLLIGSFYHHAHNCSRSTHNILISKNAADKLKMTPCPICTKQPAPEYDPTYYVTESSLWKSHRDRIIYHKKGCFSMHGNGVPIKMSTITPERYSPCSHCCPPFPNHKPKVWF